MSVYGLPVYVRPHTMKILLLLCCYIIKVHTLNLKCQVNGGVVPCPPIVHSGDQVTFTATVQNIGASNLWVLPNGTCSNSTPSNSIVLPQTAGACKDMTMTCGPYTACNADPGASNPCLTSNLTVTATSNMTSAVIQVGTRSADGQNAIARATQIVHAQPLICQVNEDVVSCPPVICPGDQVTFTATVQNLVGSNLWVLPNGTCSNSIPPDSIVLTQGAGFCKGITMKCGPYTAGNFDPGRASIPCLTSYLTVMASSSMPSLVIQFGTRTLGGQNTIVNTTQIMIIAPPGPPNVTAQTIGPDMVQVVVSPSPNGGLPTSYNVTISNSSYTRSHVVMANGSAMVTFTGLRNVSTYNISVMAINCAGNNSTQSYISWSASSPSPQTTSSVPLTSSTPTLPPNASSTPTLPPSAPNAGASATGPIVGGVVGGVIFLVIVVIIIILIVFIVLKKRTSGAHHVNGVPLNTPNSSTPATPTSVDRDSPPPPPRPSRDTPPPPPGPNTEAEYSTVDSSKKPQNQGACTAGVARIQDVT